MTHWGMYWFTRLDSFGGFFAGIAAVNMFLMLTCFGALVIGWNDLKEYRSKMVKYLIFGWLLFIPNLLIPTTKEVAAIYLIPKIANNEKLSNIAESSLNILELKAKEYLDDLAKTEKGENNVK